MRFSTMDSAGRRSGSLQRGRHPCRSRQQDEAFAALERAFAERSYLLAEYFNTDERLETLKSDPRFTELRRRIGLPQIN